MTGISLIDFSAISFQQVPAADWVFFYSSRGLAFFFAGLHHLGLTPDYFPKYATIGKDTARSLRQAGVEPTFIGNGRPNETARDFLPLARGQRVLFPRARHSQQSIQQRIGQELIALDLIVYDNRARTDIAVPFTPYVVLTSPLNAQAYYQLRPPVPQQHFIAIGPTTARAMQALGFPPFTVAEQTDETALAAALLAL